MTHVALYRKWRPSVFQDVVGQQHITRTLRNSVASGRIGHAYIFCGSHGTGKTTTARILATAVNCLNPNDGDPCNECEICRGVHDGSIMDIIEIDAASNNSVDNIRSLRDEVAYAPSRAKYKVYIIDEVHMLSVSAFNALLKTLEEPPAHVIFILATTESHKLPATIVSRCQRYEFRRISVADIVSRLTEIAGRSGATADEAALKMIARGSDGAMRDAISILDQCISSGNGHVSLETVLGVTGSVDHREMHGMIEAMAAGDVMNILTLLDEVFMKGKDPERLCNDMLKCLRNVFVAKAAGSDDADEMRLAGMLDETRMMNMIREISSTEASLRWASQPRILLEMALIKLARPYVPPMTAWPVTANGSAGAAGIPGATSAAAGAAGVPGMPGGIDASAGMGAGGNTGTTQQGGAGAPGTNGATATVGAHGATVHKQSQAKPVKPPVMPREMWKALNDQLDARGMQPTKAYLEDTIPYIVDAGQVSIVIPPNSGFKKAILSRVSVNEPIEQILSALMSCQVRVQYIDGDELTGAKTPTPEVTEDKVLQELEQRAKKHNIPFNVIDE